MGILSQFIQWIPDPSPPPLKVVTRDIPEYKPVVVHSDNDENYRRPVDAMNIHLGEHWAIVGSTGSGKTVFTLRGLLEYLRKKYPQVPRYVLDSTSDPDIFDYIYNPLPVEGNRVPDLLHSSQHTLVWTPRNSKIPDAYATWFNRLNDSHTPAIIVIDEVASITRHALAELETLFKQMRKHGGTVIAETQRIAKVDSDMFSQLTHFVQLHLNPEPYDLLQARTYLAMPKEVQRPPLHEYGGFYRRTRGNLPYVEFRDYRDFFKE